MNRLPRDQGGGWRLPNHAHLVVYAGDRSLVTVYRCGAAQESPLAQLLGRLERVDAAHESVSQPTGSVVKLREPSTLRRADGGWIVRPTAQSRQENSGDPSPSRRSSTRS
jgi:hypothetical protein